VRQEGDRRQLLSSGAREGSRGSRPRRITSSLSDAPCAASFAPHEAHRSCKILEIPRCKRIFSCKLEKFRV